MPPPGREQREGLIVLQVSHVPALQFMLEFTNAVPQGRGLAIEPWQQAKQCAAEQRSSPSLQGERDHARFNHRPECLAKDLFVPLVAWQGHPPFFRDQPRAGNNVSVKAETSRTESFGNQDGSARDAGGERVGSILGVDHRAGEVTPHR